MGLEGAWMCWREVEEGRRHWRARGGKLRAVDGGGGRREHAPPGQINKWSMKREGGREGEWQEGAVGEQGGKVGREGRR